jgi:hypothetical protein
MKLDDVIKIVNCDSKPELAGGTAQIIDLQTPQYEKYHTYPVWARMTSGVHIGKICGFRDNEIELAQKNAESYMKLDSIIKVTKCDQTGDRGVHRANR